MHVGVVCVPLMVMLQWPLNRGSLILLLVSNLDDLAVYLHRHWTVDNTTCALHMAYGAVSVPPVSVHHCPMLHVPSLSPSPRTVATYKANPITNVFQEERIKKARGKRLMLLSVEASVASANNSSMHLCKSRSQGTSTTGAIRLLIVKRTVCMRNNRLQVCLYPISFFQFARQVLFCKVLETVRTECL